MCRLLETIRVENGTPQWVEYHQRRVDRCIDRRSISLQGYIESIELPNVGCHKLRIVYCQEGIIEHTISPYHRRIIGSLQLVADDQIVYDRKAEDRLVVERLMEFRNGCDDILIVKDGLITDSSFANVALLDTHQWFTPDRPLLEGTCRCRLIENGRLIPRQITAQSLIDYQQIVLINSMLDFDPDRAIPISSVVR